MPKQQKSVNKDKARPESIKNKDKAKARPESIKNKDKAKVGQQSLKKKDKSELINNILTDVWYQINDNIVVFIDTGMQITRIRRINNSNCNITIRKCPKKMRSYSLQEITNYLSLALNISLQNHIIDMSILRSEITLHVDTYENLKILGELLSKSSMCKQHNEINCSDNLCKNTEKKLDVRNNIDLKNEIIIIAPTYITNDTILDYYKKNGIAVNGCELFMTNKTKKNINVNRYKIQFVYADDVGNVILQQLRPDKCKLILEGELTIKIKKWDILMNSLNKKPLKEYIKNKLLWTDTTKNNYPLIAVIPKTNTVTIRNGNLKNIINAKKVIDQLISPMILSFNEPLLNFLHGKESDVISIWTRSYDTEYNNMTVNIDYDNGKILVYGSEATKNNIRQNIVEYFKVNEFEYKCEIIELNSEFRKNIMNKINTIPKEAVCTINKNSLRIEGAKIFVDDTVKYIESIKLLVPDNINVITDENKYCVFCGDSILIKKTLSNCDCDYCTECFRQMILAASRSDCEKICCISCNVPISYVDISSEFNKQEIHTLVLQAFNKYMLNNSNYYKYCVSPDCNNIYCNDNNPLWRCDMCNVVYCKKCQSNYFDNFYTHDGISCRQMEIISRDLSDEDKKWILENTKACPKCNVKIEKNKGCLHMICRQCGTRFCWGCLSRTDTTPCTSFKCAITGALYV